MGQVRALREALPQRAALAGLPYYGPPLKMHMAAHSRILLKRPQIGSLQVGKVQLEINLNQAKARHCKASLDANHSAAAVLRVEPNMQVFANTLSKLE